MIESMKVLYITNIPTPYTNAMFDLLGKQCDLTVLYELKKAKNRDESWTLENTSSNFKKHYLKGIKVGEETAFNPGIIRFLKKPYDVIVTGYASLTGMLTFDYLRLKRNKHFVFNADGGLIKNDSKIKYLIKKHYIGKAPYYLSSGKTTTKYLIHYGANEKNIVEYPFTSFFAKDIRKSLITIEEKQDARKRLKIKESIMVLSVGRFIHIKGFDLLIKAAKNIDKNVGIYIVGGKPTQEYKRVKEQLKLSHVHFIDFQEGSNIKEFYTATDIFILPTRGDIWGLVINEAMAHGLPVITTDKCGAGLELVKNGVNGYIIPTEDIETITNKINFLINNAPIRTEMGRESLKKIQDYTIENVVKKHRELFNRIIKTK
jgi:glycosyltransferase involved in cell wall biosynthesis